MVPPDTSPPSVVPARVVRVSAVVAASFALLALAGWLGGNAVLQAVGGSVAMNPTSAMGILVAAAALWLQAPDRLGQRRRTTALILASLAGLVGAFKFGGYLAGVDVPIDRWRGVGVPVAPQTALDFLLVSTGLLLVDRRFGRWCPSEVFAALTVIVAFPAFVGQVLGQPSFTTVVGDRPMALNTSLAFLALGIGLATTRHESGAIGLLQRAALRTQVTVGFAVAGTVLALMAVGAMWSSVRSQRAAAERRDILLRRAAISRLLGTMQDAETGQRGYTLTSDTSFLRPYYDGTRAAEGYRADLHARLSSVAGRAPRLAQLDTLITIRERQLAENVELTATGRLAEARARDRATVGKATMDRVRSVLASLDEDEAALLALSDARVAFSDRLHLSTNVAGAIAMLVFLSIGYHAVRRNIHHREQAEDALRESEQRLFSLIEALPVAVYVLDAQGRPFYANSASKHIVGQGIDPATETDELSEVNAVYRAGTNELYPPGQLPVVRALSGDRVYVEDMEIRRRDRIVPIEVWGAPVLNSEGRVAYAVGVFNDITERQQSRALIKQLNEQLSARVDELTELNHELEAFTYSVSHDLRAPVRHIDGFARLLGDVLGEGLDGDGQRFLGRIRDGARHMGLLIDDLLQLSRVSRQGIQKQRTDLNALVRSVVFDLREDTASRAIDWRVDSLSAAECDSRLIKQVFVNLISNAVKFSRERSPAIIEIGQKDIDGRRAVFVRDNGAGFDMKYADKLFGVFQRLHHQEEFEGTGVGLAIVQRIVRKHGGRIWAEAEPGKGAAFFFSLGAAPDGQATGGS